MIEVVIPSERAGERPRWIDVVAPTAEELDRISAEYGIPHVSLEECTAPLHLPRYSRLGAITFVITRVSDPEASLDTDDYLAMTRKLAIFLGEGLLVTVHGRPLAFLDEVKSTARGASAKPPTLLTLEILLAGVETFHAPLEIEEMRIHDYESKLLREDAASIEWRAVFRTKVRIQTVKRLLWHLGNAAAKYVPRSAANEAIAHDLRERIASLGFLAETLDHDLENLLDVQLSLAANRTNDVVRVLTIFSAFFLPITFLVGVWGMNFSRMPELAQPWGYGAAWGTIGLVTGAIALWFRRLGWLRWPSRAPQARLGIGRRAGR